MISLFQAANALMGVLWAVFIPSYYSLVRCQARAKQDDRQCETSFWMNAGELVQQLWYPGVVKLEAYGANGVDRTRPGSDQQVLRPACVPCPTDLVAIQSTPYKDGPQWTSAPEYQQGSRIKCVRVDGFNLRPDVQFTTGRGGQKMSAREYLWYQLFGSKWREVEQWFLSFGDKAVDAADVKAYLFSDKVAAKDQRFNHELFQRGAPWPWMRAKWSTAKVKNPMQQELEWPALLDYEAAASDGYYAFAGVPFIPPRLWDVYQRASLGNDQPTAYVPGSTGNWVLSPVASTQFPNTNALSRVSYPLSSKVMKDQCATKQQGWYYEGWNEREWWYPGARKVSVPNGEVYLTSLVHWTDEMCLDYIARYFAGGEETIAIWHAAK